mmetsp:Transcript_3398/g.7606  ORF Transcript_3398/g.7606 Transcript_3398/m.7606 type:complete len:221 (+) Transcript_3398:187-849(+)
MVEDEIVGHGHLIALLLLQRLEQLLPLEADLHHDLVEHVAVDGTELRHDLVRRHREVEGQALGEPSMAAYLGYSDPLQGVDDEHARDELLDVVGHVAGQCEDAALDLLEEVGNVLVVKGERAAQQRIENHAAAPHVHLGSGVELARDDFGRRVVGRAAARLEEVAVLHDVGEAEVGDAELLVAVEQQVLRLEVAVHHRVLVAVLDARHELLEHDPRPGLR